MASSVRARGVNRPAKGSWKMDEAPTSSLCDATLGVLGAEAKEIRSGYSVETTRDANREWEISQGKGKVGRRGGEANDIRSGCSPPSSSQGSVSGLDVGILTWRESSSGLGSTERTEDTVALAEEEAWLDLCFDFGVDEIDHVGRAFPDPELLEPVGGPPVSTTSTIRENLLSLGASTDEPLGETSVCAG